MASARTIGLNEIISGYHSLGGDDFDTFSLWEGLYDVDNMTLQQNPVLEIAEGDHDDVIIFGGGTSDATYGRKIRPKPGVHHGGIGSSGGARIVSTGTSHIFNITEDHVVIEDITVGVDTDFDSTIICILIAGENVEIVGVIIDDPQNIGTGNTHGFYSNSGAGNDAFLMDCIAYGGFLYPFYFVSGTTYAYNSTADLQGNATRSVFEAGASISHLQNFIADGSTFKDFDVSDPASTMLNCASGDVTAVGTGARISQTFTFVNTGLGDYHLAPGDTGALGFGADLSADLVYPLNRDIDNYLIDTWSIGADSENHPPTLIGADGSVSADQAAIALGFSLLASEGSLSQDQAVLMMLVALLASDGSVSADQALLQSIASLIASEGSLSSDSGLLFLAKSLAVSDGAVSSDIGVLNLYVPNIKVEAVIQLL